MPSTNHIRNPLELGLEQLWTRDPARSDRPDGVLARRPLAIRAIDAGDLRDALAKGLGDLGAYRADILFIGLIYPLAGVILAQIAYGHALLPMVFPMASGFALLGPVAAVGLYEISRRREQGMPITWLDAFTVIRSPAFRSIVALGLVLVAIFLTWLAAAYGIFLVTLGPNPPASLPSFAHDLVFTAPGWAMIVGGMAVGLGFAGLVLAISAVSFPLMLDRNTGVGAAVATSIRAVAANPRTMALWGLIVAGSLFLGSLPGLAGLIFVVPVLGHATWHLYRRLVAET